MSPALSQPWTISVVAERLANFTTQAGLFADDLLSGYLWASSANTIDIYAGGAAVGQATAADSAGHAIQSVIQSTTSTINVDGTTTTPGASIGTGTFGNRPDVGEASGAFASMYFGEGGVASGGQSGTVQTNVCHNQITYFGITGSC